MLSCWKNTHRFIFLKNCVISWMNFLDERPAHGGSLLRMVIFHNRLFQVVLNCPPGYCFPNCKMCHSHLDSLFIQIPGSHFQRFWFIVSGVGPENLHFQDLRCFCWWSGEDPLTTSVLEYCSCLCVEAVPWKCLSSSSWQEEENMGRHISLLLTFHWWASSQCCYSKRLRTLV